jgi:hypothetical protein
MAHTTEWQERSHWEAPADGSTVVVDNDRVDREAILVEIDDGHPVSNALLGFELLRSLSLQDYSIVASKSRKQLLIPCSAPVLAGFTSSPLSEIIAELHLGLRVRIELSLSIALLLSLLQISLYASILRRR